jgi:hypothetical protein
MEFNTYISAYQDSKKISHLKHLTINQLYNDIIPTVSNPAVRFAIHCERNWLLHNSPYYALYPSLAEGLRKLKLDIPCECIEFPLPEVLIRFAKGYETIRFISQNKEWRVRSFLASQDVDTHKEKGFVLNLEIGEEVVMPLGIIHPKSLISVKLADNTTIDDTINNAYSIDNYDEPDPRVPIDIFKECAKIVCGLSVLDQTEETLFSPDILVADREKFAATRDPKYIEKAKKRGKYGWLVGVDYVVNPAYIKPHWQHYHVGPKRAKVIYKLKRGFFIKREEIRNIPTGYGHATNT